MNWFDTSGLTSLAKSALKEAQKTIDKALDIQDEIGDGSSTDPPTPKAVENEASSVADSKNTDFLSSWGLTTSGGDVEESTIVEQPIITESPAKSEPQGIWGSFAGSLFEQKTLEKSQSQSESIENNPNHLTHETSTLETGQMVSETEIDSYRRLSELELNFKNIDSFPVSESVSKKEEVPLHGAPKDDKQCLVTRLNRLSIVSSDSGKDSSESVELLGSQSLKTTPDSEAVSLIQSISQSSKLNSDSVEILPDSLVSPSSIECLGFEGNITDGLKLSPFEEDQSITGNQDSSAEGETRDKSSESVSLIVDDDEDTISYNSVSECTVPTVLDTNDENPTPTHSDSYMQKIQKHITDGMLSKLNVRASLDSKYTDIMVGEDVASCSLIQSTVIRVNPVTKSYPSSNDGSWSDRTLNADSESAINESGLEDSVTKTNTEQTQGAISLSTYDETSNDKMSDSSSFCNVTESGDILSSITSINQSFITIDKFTSSSDRADAPLEEEQRDQHSPMSSESRSDLVKVGSDQTSGHTSGDEIETTTSSDIEIIPSPNGDQSHPYCRQSPAKCSQRKSVNDLISSNLVELVLGKTLATKVRGHSRELSEASIQSNTSEESHCSESEKLMRRLCDMADVLEARESRLIEVSRHNVELNEANTELKTQLEIARAKIEIGEISMITEDYTQRLTALEKKFQQAIKEKDILRKQMDVMKQEATVNSSTSSGEAIKEKEDIIRELREEGEKLSKQHFNQSTVIKKLRAKEKDTELLVKKLKDRVSEQTQEIERLKRSVGAKEELECSQIEAVYKLTNSNKKLETELFETKSALDDALNRLQTSKTSLDAARKELTELQRNQADVRRKRDTLGQLERDKSQLDAENEQLRRQLEDLRAKMVQEESAWARREERLRGELSSARAREAEAECREAAERVGAEGGAGLLTQLSQLQHSALARERQHQAQIAALTHHHSEAESKLSAIMESERGLREECSALQERAGQLESALSAANARLEDTSTQCQLYLTQLTQAEDTVNRLTKELAATKASSQSSLAQLTDKLAVSNSQLAAERISAEAEKRRNTILQEQVRELSSQARGSPLAALLCEDSSPPHSIASESLGSSHWHQEESEFGRVGGSGGGAAACSSALVESLQASLWRREGELRAAAAGARRAAAERAGLAAEVARLTADLHNLQAVQNQYDALLQMYGEKEEQLQELDLDLQDVKDLYKMQLDEIILLRRQVAEHKNG